MAQGALHCAELVTIFPVTGELSEVSKCIAPSQLSEGRTVDETLGIHSWFLSQAGGLSSWESQLGRSYLCEREASDKL